MEACVFGWLGLCVCNSLRSAHSHRRSEVIGYQCGVWKLNEADHFIQT